MFNRLFKSSVAPKDGLTQSQREAMVDLLNYCMFADSLITISESRFVEAKVDSFDWDPKISFDYYQGKSIGSARAALDNPESKKDFFSSIEQRLVTPALRKQAFALCLKLFMTDGTTSDTESALQSEIRRTLRIA